MGKAARGERTRMRLLLHKTRGFPGQMTADTARRSEDWRHLHLQWRPTVGAQLLQAMFVAL